MTVKCNAWRSCNTLPKFLHTPIWCIKNGLCLSSSITFLFVGDSAWKLESSDLSPARSECVSGSVRTDVISRLPIELLSLGAEGHTLRSHSTTGPFGRFAFDLDRSRTRQAMVWEWEPTMTDRPTDWSSLPVLCENSDENELQRLIFCWKGSNSKLEVSIFYTKKSHCGMRT